MSQKIYEGSIREQLADISGHSKVFARQFSVEFFQLIREGLLEDGYVRLHQFGSFKLKWTDQRKGINPQTGEAIVIAAHPRILFNPAKHLTSQANSILYPATTESLTVDTGIADEPQVINNNTSSKPEKPRQPLPKLDIEPYLAQNSHAHKKPSKSTAISYKAMAAGFILVCVSTYLLLPEKQSVDYTTAPKQMPVQITQPANIETEYKNQKTLQKKVTNIEAELITEQTPDISNNKLSQPLNSSTHPINNQILTTETAIQSQNLNPEQPTETSDVFFAARKYKLVNGNSLWRLSKKNYVNPFYWPHIYQANRYKIHNPDKLIIGRTITLPTLYGQPDNLTAIDKRNIAEGYFLAYQYYKRKNAPYPYYALLGAAKYDPSIIKKYIYEIADEDWENLQLASNLSL